MKLIDKDAVLAEIKELSSAIKIQLDYKKGDAFWIAQKLLLERLKEKIDTLEVKEADLEKEISEYFVEHSDEFFSDKYKLIAKHFFELGMKTSNQLTWEDIACIEDITSTILTECKDKILYDTQESFCKEVLKRFKAQKNEQKEKVYS